MSFLIKTNEYLINLEAFYLESRRVQEMTRELSYRPLLDNYFSEIIVEIATEASKVFEPRQQANAGRPDWRFYDQNTLGVFGYIEAKAIDPEKEIRVDDYRGQVEKYLSLGHRVILTDGIEFLFFTPGQDSFRRLAIITKSKQNLSRRWSRSDEISALELEFRNFFTGAKARRVSEEQLISDCALRGRLLAKNIAELSDLPIGSGFDDSENRIIEVLNDLKGLIEKHHDPLLKEKEAFATFVAQVLIFGLIYAHRVLGVSGDTPRERYARIHAFWLEEETARRTEHLKPFKALVLLLKSELYSLSALGTWYEDCCLMLGHVELRDDQVNKPDYHNLFERFLAAFDPKTRFDYGAFYTPKELASYAVRLVEKISERDLPNLFLYGEGNKLIDPCCGTGSFLESLFLSSVEKGGAAEIFGFEILPAPYALAHYRISNLSPEYKNTKIVLTNTLSNDLEEEHGNIRNNLFEEEQSLAREIASPPLTLIIGNPPSSDSSSHSQGKDFSIIHELLNDFRPPESTRKSRQNTQKQLQNEYVKFLRWAGNKAIQSKDGIVALVVPSSFAESPSYLFARKWYASKFSNFFVLDLDLDARTGVRASSIFNTLQGRLLFIAYGKVEKHEPKERKFYYASIADFDRSKKISFLKSFSENPEQILNSFNLCRFDQQNPTFRPIKDFDRTKYLKFWSLYSGDEKTDKYIFSRHCSGLKLAPSSLFVHADEAILKRRSREIGDESISVSQLTKKWYEGQSKPPQVSKFSPEVRRVFAAELENMDLVAGKYSYRPFVNLAGFISKDILVTLSKVGGGGTRYRPEMLSAFSDARVCGIAVAPSPKDIGEHLHRFASFCWYLPDNDLSKRGNAHVFCNYFPEYKTSRKEWDQSPKLNYNDKLVNYVGEQNSDKIIFYTYAILCSDVFLDEFEPVLFTTSGADQQPRIPITSDRTMFNDVALLGKALAEMEKDTPNENFQLDEWESGVVNSLVDNFKLDSFSLNEENETLVLKSNDKGILEIGPVPKEILGFTVGGYQVLQQWLKIYSYVYTRTDFNKKHLAKLLITIRAIKNQIQIIEEINQKVKIILSADSFLDS